MKRLFLSLLFITCIFKVNGQSSSTYVSPAIYFNKFQDVKYSNVDSAVYCLQKLFAVKEFDEMGVELLHNTFAQDFMIPNNIDLKNPKSIEHLKKRDKYAPAVMKKLLVDSNIRLKTSVLPIYLWTEAQKYSKDAKKLQKIGNDYTTLILKSGNLFEDRKGRYGLMIYKILAEYPSLDEVSNKLFGLLSANLLLQQVNVDSIKASVDKRRRGWYRYLYAYSNYLLAQKSVNQNDKAAAEKYYKQAYNYSPDNLDMSRKDAFFYDMMFMLGEEKYTFADDYFDFLSGNDSSFLEKTKVIMAMSLKDPAYKDQAKKLFRSKFSTADFNKFWIDEFNNIFKPAPFFALKKLDGSVFSLTDNKGKWTLIDFWGTWCKPCREEHPDLQKLYLASMGGDMPDLTILTIASNDYEERVKTYMKENKYSFPVAMSDHYIEGVYDVGIWPSKFLISPQGKFLIIPSNIDWVKYIRDYIN